jgi:hypothetical protein
VKVESLQAEGGGLKANRNRPKVEETRCILGFYCHLNRQEKLTVRFSAFEMDGRGSRELIEAQRFRGIAKWFRVSRRH